MQSDVVQVGHGCAYCLKPFERRMIPVTLHSSRHGNSQIWLHVPCFRAAFAGAAAPIGADLEDMTVDLGERPSA